MEWKGKVVLITGASSGLGRGLAIALAARGADLVVTARRASLLSELAAEVEALGRRCVAVPADATDPADVQRVLDAAAALGPVDVAVLNAGGGDGAVLGEVSAAEVLGSMRKNYDSIVLFLCPLIASMRERGGVIANTSSPAGFFGLPRSGPYSAAKAAGRQLFDCARIDLAHTPIRFVTLFPGFTDTDALDKEDVPVPALVISRERAVAEMVWALEAGRERYMFPRRIRWLIGVGAWLPVRVREAVLGWLGG
jgi:NAD(P)-dependent dehydrogenase (short-subunit alcohol dehydrogenase family)